MNIFVVDNDPQTAAEMLCDKHIVKMVLETAQIMSTVVQEASKFRIYELYKPTHLHHPCTIWAGNSKENFEWLYIHGIALAYEYEQRYKKEHKSLGVIMKAGILDKLIPEGKLTPFAQAMPDEYKDPDAVTAYRNYYNAEKAKIAVWTNRLPPTWFKESI